MNDESIELILRNTSNFSGCNKNIINKEMMTLVLKKRYLLINPIPHQLFKILPQNNNFRNNDWKITTGSLKLTNNQQQFIRSSVYCPLLKTVYSLNENDLLWWHVTYGQLNKIHKLNHLYLVTA